MKNTFIFFSLVFLVASGFHAQATIWRVNNTTGASANFTTFDSAWQNASVQNGDTIYVEGSPTNYTNNSPINKRLVIIGPGYFLSGTGANIGLQANENNASFGIIRYDSLASGSKFYGIQFTELYVDPRADSILFERCRFGSISWNFNGTAGQRIVGMRFNKCYFTGTSIPATHVYEGLEVTNCIITGSFTLKAANVLSALVRNNLFSVPITINNTYFANNISLNIGSTSFIAGNSIVRNNIAEFANVFPAGNGNQNSIAESALFVGATGNSTDGQWQLKAGSPAIGAGETVNGVTPDCGPFGTPDPYRLSGIPAIPTIYSLTVPQQVPTGSTSMNITISTRSNN